MLESFKEVHEPSGARAGNHDPLGSMGSASRVNLELI